MIQLLSTNDDTYLINPSLPPVLIPELLDGNPTYGDRRLPLLLMRRLKAPPQPRYIMTCLTIAYILELVAWHSWKLAVRCLSVWAKRGLQGVWATCLEIWSSVSLPPLTSFQCLPAAYVYSVF